jgi:hypothetical protein
MKRVMLVPNGWPCTLAACPPGPFTDVEGHLGFKTEYGSTRHVDGALRVTNHPDVYCLESGETWCSDVSVQPLIVVIEEQEK